MCIRNFQSCIDPLLSKSNQQKIRKIDFKILKRMKKKKNVSILWKNIKSWVSRNDDVIGTAINITFILHVEVANLTPGLKTYPRYNVRIVV